ncbi:TPA: HNH endonuclease, partial [Escherichia coli]|nr:HNH endonuclease [Escherichia coli]
QKSAREAVSGMPDPMLPEVSGGHGRADDIIGL